MTRATRPPCGFASGEVLASSRPAAGDWSDPPEPLDPGVEEPQANSVAAAAAPKGEVRRSVVCAGRDRAPSCGRAARPPGGKWTAAEPLKDIPGYPLRLKAGPDGTFGLLIGRVDPDRAL